MVFELYLEFFSIQICALTVEEVIMNGRRQKWINSLPKRKSGRHITVDYWDLTKANQIILIQKQLTGENRHFSLVSLEIKWQNYIVHPSKMWHIHGANTDAGTNFNQIHNTNFFNSVLSAVHKSMFRRVCQCSSVALSSHSFSDLSILHLDQYNQTLKRTSPSTNAHLSSNLLFLMTHLVTGVWFLGGKPPSAGNSALKRLVMAVFSLGFC